MGSRRFVANGLNVQLQNTSDILDNFKTVIKNVELTRGPVVRLYAVFIAKLSWSFVSAIALASTSALHFAANIRVLRRAGDSVIRGNLCHERFLREGYLRRGPRAAYGNALRLYSTPLYASGCPRRIWFAFMHASSSETALILVLFDLPLVF